MGLWEVLFSLFNRKNTKQSHVIPSPFILSVVLKFLASIWHKVDLVGQIQP